MFFKEKWTVILMVKAINLNIIFTLKKITKPKSLNIHIDISLHRIMFNIH